MTSKCVSTAKYHNDATLLQMRMQLLPSALTEFLFPSRYSLTSYPFVIEFVYYRNMAIQPSNMPPLVEKLSELNHLSFRELNSRKLLTNLQKLVLLRRIGAALMRLLGPRGSEIHSRLIAHNITLPDCEVSQSLSRRPNLSWCTATSHLGGDPSRIH